MAATSSPRGAILTVRIWREPGVPGFRGRVSYRVDATEAAETEIVVHTMDQLHMAVQEWLDAFVADNPPPAK